MTLQAGDLIGPYRLTRLCGAGAMADVWQAQEPINGYLVALKMLRPGASPLEAAEQERRFLAEAQTARLLHHADIVKVLDQGRTSQGQAWMALEWLHGQPLARHTAADQRLPTRTVLQIAQRVARALDHAHQRGVVHRDIKPDNILFDGPTDQVKIADFGVSRVEDSSATQTGTILGTPAYMAPEQLAGAPASPLGDLYSLGVVAFELLTSRRPIEASSLGQWLRRISQEPATPLGELRPDLPVCVGQIVDRLLERNPASRHASGKDAATELARCLESCGSLEQAQPH